MIAAFRTACSSTRSTIWPEPPSRRCWTRCRARRTSRSCCAMCRSPTARRSPAMSIWRASAPYEYRPGEESKLIQIPSDMADDGALARQEMLESLADFDDGLLEQLLEGRRAGQGRGLRLPDRDPAIGQHRAAFHRLGPRTTPASAGCSRCCATRRPAWRRSATGWKRAAGAATARPSSRPSTCPIPASFPSPRVLDGEIKDGMTLNGNRVSGMNRLNGYDQEKVAARGEGRWSWPSAGWTPSRRAQPLTDSGRCAGDPCGPRRPCRCLRSPSRRKSARTRSS